MSQQSARPLAEGELEQTPLAHVLLHVYGRGLSGSLTLTDERGERSIISFGRGRPHAAHTRAAAGADLQEAIVPLCGCRAGHYQFHGTDMLAGVPGVVRGSVDPLALVAASIHQHARTAVVDALLARYGEHSMRLLPGQPVARLGLNSRQNTLIEVLRAGPDTVANLLRMSPMPERDTRNLLYLLVITRMVAPYGRASAESHVRMSSVTPPPPVQQSGEHAAVSEPPQRTISSRPTDAVRSLLRQTSLTPAPFPAQGSRTPLPPRSSLAPRSSLTPRPTTEYQVDPDDPAVKLRRAEKRLLAGRPEDALLMAEELLQQDPQSARYLGLRAYALVSFHRSQSDRSVGPEVTTAIQEALVADENEPRALYAKGLAFSHMGKLKNALHFFRRAVDADPSFIPAKRDAHLAEMRLRQAK